MSSRLARSKGRRRKRRARSLVIEVSLATAAFALGAVALAGPLSHLSSANGAPVSGTAAAPAPAPSATHSPAGELKVAGATTERRNEEKASGPSKFTDQQATAYFMSKWNDHAATRVKDIRTTGHYLRIYTNLPDGDLDSKDAITLCKRGLEYLAERGVTDPVVFVQAKFGENGNPVLANVLGPDDSDCRVTAPKPK